MALARKGSRSITVEGAAYRWVVAPNDGYMLLVAEPANGLGQRLEAYFGYHDIYEPAEAEASRVVGQRRSIRPGVVRAVVQAALGRGWQPSKRGLPAFQLHDADRLVPLGDSDC
jgi:hypothetical protein